MNRAEAISRALRVVDDAFAIDSTPPNYPCPGGMVDQLVYAELLGGIDHVPHYSQWSKEGIAAFVAVFLEHAPAALFRGRVRALTKWGEWLQEYRVLQDVDVEVTEERRFVGPAFDTEVERRAKALSPFARRRALTRQLNRERAHADREALRTLRASRRLPPKSLSGSASTHKGVAS